MAAPTVLDLKLVCHLENGNVTNTAAGYNRDTAITITANPYANCSAAAAAGRPMCTE